MRTVPLSGVVAGARSAPLSNTQETLLLAEMTSRCGAYQVHTCLRLRGELDAAALRAALEWVANRHEPLRCAIVGTDPPVQLIEPMPRLDLGIIELTGPDAEGRAIAEAVDEIQRPFQLDAGPLWRARLWRLADGDHVFLWCAHEIACDDRSTSIVLAEIAAAYSALRAGAPPSLEELPLTYSEYLDAERARLGRPEVRDAHIGYWRDRLAGVSDLELPADHPRPVRPGPHGAVVRRTVAPRTGETVLGMAGSTATGRLSVLAAAGAALLRHYTGQNDIVIGITGDVRRSPEARRLAGSFDSALPLRVDLTGSPSWRELIARCDAAVREALNHQALSFQQIVEAAHIPLEPSRAPLFEFAIAVDDDQVPEFSGVTAERMPLDTGTAQLDMTVTARFRPDSLDLTARFRTSRYETATVERFLAQLEDLLAAAAAAPDRPVETTVPRAPGEPTVLVHRWTEGPRAAPPATVAELFGRQVVRAPDAPALEAGTERLDFRELDRRANRLAHLLQARGAGPSERVAFCLPRDVNLPITVLAILKAGAAYVPLDPTLPAERLRYILDDARPVVVLADSTLTDRLPRSDAPVLIADRLDAESARLPDTAPPAKAGADDLAYVLYTSGSTGRPKGVAMPHRPLVNLLTWQQSARRGTTPGTGRTLQFTTIGFDVAFQELFSTWCGGDALVVADEQVRVRPDLLLQALRERGITTAYLPFVALDQLAQAARPHDELPAHLRDVYQAGEQLKITPALRALFTALPGCLLHNQYGPTETHVCAEHTLDGPAVTWPELPPIGRPIDGARCVVLGRDDQPVPAGGIGSLHVGGVQLAAGYLGNAELTRQRFKLMALDGPVERYYDTGDLVRIGPHGELQYLGRGDTQVKIRGYRVELGEIETALAAHPAVAAAVVELRTLGATPALVAYWLPAGDIGDDADDAEARFHEHLDGLLAPYMLPRRYVRLDRFPLTSSGKVDRRALPDPPDIGRGRDVVPLTTPWEQIVADVLERRLSSGPVGRDDRFFDLGGHSLAALGVISEIKDQTGAQIPVALLLGNGDVAEMGAALEQMVVQSVRPGQLEDLLDKVEELDPEGVARHE